MINITKFPPDVIHNILGLVQDFLHADLELGLGRKYQVLCFIRSLYYCHQLKAILLNYIVVKKT